MTQHRALPEVHGSGYVWLAALCCDVRRAAQKHTRCAAKAERCHKALLMHGRASAVSCNLLVACVRRCLATKRDVEGGQKQRRACVWGRDGGAASRKGRAVRITRSEPEKFVLSRGILVYLILFILKVLHVTPFITVTCYSSRLSIGQLGTNFSLTSRTTMRL